MKTILLDLNVTLVENSKVHNMPVSYNVPAETYRKWLVEKVRDHHVILITVRPILYQRDTVAHIKALTGWQPNEFHFNPWAFMKASACKEKILTERIFHHHGRPDQNQNQYLAIESNEETREMYKRHGITAIRHDSILLDEYLAR